MSNPITNPTDFVILAGRRSPGIAEVTSADSPRRWDERRGYGLSGARTIFRGTGLAYPKLLLRLYTPEDFEAWNEWRPLVQAPPAGERPRALQIEHPFLEDLGIRAVNVKNVKQPVQTGDGEWTVEIEMIEYREPVPALAAPRGTTNGPPLTPNQLEILDLTSQLEVLARPRGAS